MRLVSDLRVSLILVPTMSQYEIAKILKHVGEAIILIWPMPAMYGVSSIVVRLLSVPAMSQYEIAKILKHVLVAIILL